MEEKELRSQILEELESISIPSSFKEWVVKYLEKHEAEEVESGKRIREAEERHYKQIDTKLDDLLNLRLENKITDEDYQKKKSKLETEKEELGKILKTPIQRSWVEEFKETLNVAEDIRQAFENGDEKTQKRILTSLGSNLVIQDKRFAIKGSNPILQLKSAVPEIKRLNARFEPLKTAQQKEKLELSYSSSPIMLRLLNTIRTSIQRDKASKFYYFGLKRFLGQSA